MTDMQTAGRAALPASALDRMITRAGRALVAWSAHRELRRAQRLAARVDVPKSSAGILDLDAPRAVRSFGFPPGIFR
jgi:hypothetical protein